MGYRSEVGILITLPENTTKNEIIKELASEWKEEEFNDCFSVVELNEGKCVYIHTEYDLKWYEDIYEDVKGTMEWINDFEERYDTGGVHFLRIGENLDDTEEIIVGEPERYIEFYRYMRIE